MAPWNASPANVPTTNGLSAEQEESLQYLVALFKKVTPQELNQVLAQSNWDREQAY